MLHRAHLLVGQQLLGLLGQQRRDWPQPERRQIVVAVVGQPELVAAVVELGLVAVEISVEARAPEKRHTRAGEQGKEDG